MTSASAELLSTSPTDAPSTSDTQPTGASVGAARVLIYASFWGRAWRDGEGQTLAAEVAQALRRRVAEAGLGLFMQSSFFFDGSWYEGAAPPQMNTTLVTRVTQVLLDRAVVPEATGRDDGATALLVIFPDASLLQGAVDTPGWVGQFQTRGGNLSHYAVAPDVRDASDAGARKGAEALVAPAVALVAAMRAAATPDQAPADGRPGDQAGQGGANSAGVEEARLLPLPSLYAEARIPRFWLDDEDLERYLVKLAWPLNLEELSGAGLILRRASALIDAKVLAREARPRPASQAELQDFNNPNPRVTIPERLAALKFLIGEAHPDVALVERILDGVSDPALAQLRATYLKNGASSFLDVVFFTYHKLRLARTLGLETGPARSVWDIGCGGGHFSRVCRHFGHFVLGTDQQHPVYGDIANVLGVERTINIIEADTPTADFGRRFDVVTAIAVEFNHLYPRGVPPRYWTLDHWRFLFNDLMRRQLNFPGRIYIDLNCEQRDGRGVYNVELMRLCAQHGADVNERRGLIDWKFDAPIEV